MRHRRAVRPSCNRSAGGFSILARRSSRAPQPASPNHYGVEELEKSLSLSLRQLQRDRIDILFLHEPGKNDLIAANMGEALQEAKAGGKIGAFGLSGHRGEVEHYLKTRPEVCGDAIQYQYSLLKNGPESEPLRYAFTGMFSVIDGTLGPLSAYLAEHGNSAREWSDRLGIELKKRENVGIVILALALVLNPQGVVLFFTSSPKRLRQVVRRLKDNHFSEENLLAFRAAITGDLHAN
jgi:diketogulonate reductase-like aldo/keto reductase